MKNICIKTLFQGFPGKSKDWDLGWGAVYLVQRDGKNILVDCGGPSVTIYIKDKLNSFGLYPKDIDMVLITHFHWDHVYNCKLFENAEFIFSQKELEHTNGGKDLLSFKPALDYVLQNKYRVITEDNEVVEDGIKAIFVQGHTPGSLAFVINTKEGKWVFTGDAIKNRVDLKTEVLCGSHDRTSSESIKRIKNIADIIAPGHDGIINLKTGVIKSNDVIIKMPEGLTVNGYKQVVLSLDSNCSE